ncbi:MAG TPA: hypothetical protein VK907_10160 [Phnomibacter sp.]|nr:hypothetical protein [Phnomibacter sp.]
MNKLHILFSFLLLPFFSVNAQSLPGWVHSTGAKTFPALGGEPDIY